MARESSFRYRRWTSGPESNGVASFESLSCKLHIDGATSVRRSRLCGVVETQDFLERGCNEGAVVFQIVPLLRSRRVDRAEGRE